MQLVGWSDGWMYRWDIYALQFWGAIEIEIKICVQVVNLEIMKRLRNEYGGSLECSSVTDQSTDEPFLTCVSVYIKAFSNDLQYCPLFISSDQPSPQLHYCKS